MAKYETLLRVLDQIRDEARETKWKSVYAVGSRNSEKISQARSRAYIHLYLKVMFGMASFSDREHHVTDGSYDGGIDGYYIDSDLKRIYLLQSKFRRTAKNFESTRIAPEELLSMDIDRITGGEEEDEAGNKYNGKIQGLARAISETTDIARYKYYVVIIANCNIQPSHVRKLTGGYNAEIFDYDRTYRELLFPIISGTYFKASDLTLQLDLNHKSASAKTSYSVLTPKYECEITVLFVPTIEIARAMDKYRNSILSYNPRSYLDFDGKNVNNSIRETLLKQDSNEFALMNNGITILSDETNINERIGQQNKAQVRLLNPQIINGGQTAYTLSRILNESRNEAEVRFYGKEVLAKIITLTPRDPSADNTEEQQRLIQEISAATNRQTVVISTDRHSNTDVNIKLQAKLFDRFGILLERKRGEFSDGILLGYVSREDILDRNIFFRILLASRGQISRAVRKRIFGTHGIEDVDLMRDETLDQFYIAYDIFKKIGPNMENKKRYREALGKVYLGVRLKRANPELDFSTTSEIDSIWGRVVKAASVRRTTYYQSLIDRKTGDVRDVFSQEKWMASADFEEDLVQFLTEDGVQGAPAKPKTRRVK